LPSQLLFNSGNSNHAATPRTCWGGVGSGEVWLGAWALALVAKVPCLVGLLVAVAVAGCFPRDGGKAIHDETPDDTGPPPPGGPRTPMETEGFAKREGGGGRGGAK